MNLKLISAAVALTALTFGCASPTARTGSWRTGLKRTGSEAGGHEVGRHQHNPGIGLADTRVFGEADPVGRIYQAQSLGRRPGG